MKLAPSDLVKSPEVTAHLLKECGTIPNNPRLPVLVYSRALKLPTRDPASAIEELLRSNRWKNGWRNGIFTYHHYHSTAHEVLVVFNGSAKVQLGGEEGMHLDIHPSDVLILPAGVGHKNLGSTSDFAVFGAYPEGQEYDILYGKPGERPNADIRIAAVPLPETDPVYGEQGPLFQHWH